MTSPEWTPTTLTTLMHALALSPPDAVSLLPQTQTQISSILQKISVSLNNPPSWTMHRHTRAVLKSVTGLTPPPRPRKKKQPNPPTHRISLQLIPATPHDDIAVRAVGAYPFLEVVLKARRRAWDVVKHIYQKWGLPVTLEMDRKLISVDSLVIQLVEKGCRTVRLPYRVVKIDIDWKVLKCALPQNNVAVGGKKRVLALRDDHTFWTGHFDKLPLTGEAPSPVEDDVCRYSSQGSDNSGEQAVMSRLRGHLDKLQGDDDGGIIGAKETRNERNIEVEEDPAVIPERFLRSCSRFEFAHSLPDSLLSLGKSDGSGDEKGGASGNVGTAERDVGGDCNPLQVMNDALDLRHELDLRCDEQLDGMEYDEFMRPNLDNIGPPPSLSLSALFPE